ncbi:hypothetical protein Cgig2_024863 [Carnegiea gigantea]|uniref:Dof-type domain-containing protein n=1 Tax=Carnegiea gigantea TaxID=171969 RepID=A0A9Q1KEF3_9CARY|nr:hypothetical protein Cgig2_024863 [Carnegiea gigantea]
MAGIKDPAIKLFGKMIQLHLDSNGDYPPTAVTTDADYGCSDHNILCSKQGKNRGEEKSFTEELANSKIEEERSLSMVFEGCKTPPSPSTPTENPKTLSKKDDQCDQASSTQYRDQNSPKKPDKILRCGRCSSMNTKFCYFNNYNVNQPRHFCKNCQRYWTAGGTMRNMPHLVISAPPNELIDQALRPNGSLITFGSNSPHSESMPPTLNLVETPQSYTPNGKENLGFLSNANLTWTPIPLESRFPVPLYSTLPKCAPATWNLEWVSTPQNFRDQSSLATSSNSSSLGKHARDGSMEKVGNQGLGILKTLRINYLNEAAKSSMWGTLGIKNDKVCSSNGGGFSKGFIILRIPLIMRGVIHAWFCKPIPRHLQGPWLSIKVHTQVVREIKITLFR